MNDQAQPAGAARETLLLVGASSDIGLEVIRREAAAGALVLAHCNASAAKLEALGARLPGTELVVLQADLAAPGGVEALVAAARQHPLPDKIVYLAAPKLAFIRFKDGTWEDFQRELDIQLRGLAGVLRAFLPEMARRRRGKVVVLLSSVTVNVPQGALSHYVTAKFAMLGLTRALAAEYASRRLNINAVSPSMVETAFLDQVPGRMVEIAASQCPRQEHATTADVAAAVGFLLSSGADYLTGVNLPVTGGAAF